MTVRIAADTAVLMVLIAITLVLLGATLRTLADALRHRH